MEEASLFTEQLKPKLLELMESVDRNAGTAHPSGITNVTHGQDLVIRLFAGSRMLFRATILLLREGYSEEARILSRTLLDDVARLFFLLKHRGDLEKLAHSFRLWSLHEGLRLIRFEKQLGLPGADSRERKLSEVVESARSDAEEQVGGAIPPFPKTAGIVKELDQKDLYWFYKVASQSVHTTTLALESRAQEIGDAHFVIGPEGSPEVALMVGLLACEMFSSATAAAATMLGWDTVGEVESFRKTVRKEVAGIRTQAISGGILLEYEEDAGA